MSSEKTDEIRDACLKNAKALLSAARAELERKGSPNISLHLAVLALEEIAKASMVALRQITAQAGRETTYLDNRWEDHGFKLFWAIWLPGSSDKLTAEGFKEAEELADSLHEARMASAYVKLRAQEDESPIWNVPPERAEAVLGLAEARLGIEKSAGISAFDPDGDCDLEWFIKAADDPEKRRQLFGSKSLQKRSELGDVKQWIKWLREQFEKAEAEAKAAMQAELERAPPPDGELGNEKWRVSTRFYSSSQSIRPAGLRRWNESVPWIQLKKAGDNFTLDAEFTFKEAVSFQSLYHISYSVGRQFLAALNIGSTGFWWWDKVENGERFYRKIVDLEKPEMGVGVSMQGATFKWHKQALKELQISRVLACFAAIAGPDGGRYPKITDPYLLAITTLAKSDIHLNLAHHSCENFSQTILAALVEFENWDGKPETLLVAVTGAYGDLLDDEEDLTKLTSWLAAPLPESGPKNMERAAMLKILCDGYLIRKFDEVLMLRAEAEASNPASESGAEGHSESPQ